MVLARRLGKPLKYTETRSESLMAAHHGRDQWQKLTLSAEKDGTRHRAQGRAAGRPRLLRRASSVAASRCWARSCSTRSTSSRPTSSACQTVLTNKTWTDAYRGAGRPEATYAIERLMDELADELGRRPAGGPREELDQARGVPVHHGGRPGVRLRQLRGGHPDGQGQLRVRRAPGRAEAASGVRTTPSSSASASRRSPRCAAWRPSRVLGSLDYGAGGWEHASVRMLPTGKVEVVTGASAHGQGHETAFSQIVADRLGVPFEDVEVLHGDTAGRAQGHGHLRLALAGRRW